MRAPLRRLVDSEALGALRDNEQTRLMAYGVGAGVVGGLAAAGFDGLMVGVANLFMGTPEPSVQAPFLPWVLLAPVLGGVLVGGIIAKLTYDGRARGIADVMQAVTLEGGATSLRNGVASGLAAAIALGVGHSGGREGPIVQLASALTSWTARRLKVPPARLRVLVAAGAAAGIAASFNTPVGAAFFAMEILLCSFAMEGFAPIVAATVTGTVVGQALLGDRLALDLPACHLSHPAELITFPVLGILCGLLAAALRETLALAARHWDTLPLPPILRPTVAGLAVGLLALAGMPEVMGNGYAFVEVLIDGRGGSAAFLVALLIAKVATVGLSTATRNGVGSFAPSLFAGAVVGTLFGDLAGTVLPLGDSSTATYGIVGMGAVVAALNQAPLTMTLMLFEMTGNYRVILPLMLTIAVASVVYRAVVGRSLVLHQLAERGVEVERSREELVMYELHAADILRTYFPSVPCDASLDQLVKVFLSQRTHEVYVVDDEGKLHGVVDLHDVKAVLAQPSPEGAITEVERRDVPSIRPTLPLAEALPLFFRHDREELPVVDDEGKLVGILTERDVVGAYNREVLRKDSLLTRIESQKGAERQVDFLELPQGQRIGLALVDDEFASHTLRALSLPARFGVTVLAVDVWDPRAGRHVRLAPDADLQLRQGDRIVVLGPEAQVQALTRPLGQRDYSPTTVDLEPEDAV